MKFLVAKNPVVLQGLLPKMKSPSFRVSVEDWAKMIGEMMVISPERVLVGVIFSSTEEEEFHVHSFLIACDSGVGDYVSVLQAWDEKGTVPEPLMVLLEEFCQKVGKTILRQELPWGDDGFVNSLPLPFREVCLVAEGKIGG